MKYKRIFAFGCSFTDFVWPTWPVIMSKDLNLPLQNWGMCGQGNVAIYHRMLEADLKNNFNESDIVIPVWTTWHREDRHLGSWTLSGNIFHDKQLYDRYFRKKYWHETNDVVKNATAIISANKMFPITYQAKLKGTMEAGKDLYSDTAQYNFYQSHLPHMDEFPWDYTQEPCVNFDGALKHIDNHPDIKAHLHFVKDYIYKELNLTMKEETIDYYTEMHNKVVQMGKQGITKKEIKKWHHLQDFFERHFSYYTKRIGM